MSCQDIMNSLKNVVARLRTKVPLDRILVEDHNNVVEALKLIQQYLENCTGKVDAVNRDK